MEMRRWSPWLLSPILIWISICSKTQAQFASGYLQLPSEIFFLKLEDGYFGCQVNDSTQILKLFPLSKLCDGVPQCFRGSDELAKQLKCTDKRNCHPRKPLCESGACLDNLCYCNNGFGGKGCQMPDENECKYRPCDVFAHCTNTMGSFYCSCYPGYEGDGFQCKDINECKDPVLAGRCVENSDCCNLPAHYKCKCRPGFEGDGTVECRDINECSKPNACGVSAKCENTVGSYSCNCAKGYTGDPYVECLDKDECSNLNACATNAKCKNKDGTYKCFCPAGFTGDPYVGGCFDVNECQINPQPCANNAECANTPGSYACRCKEGFTGDPFKGCIDINECPAACGVNSKCVNLEGSYECTCKIGFFGNPYLSAGCTDLNECDKPDTCGQNAQCLNIAGSYKCRCLPGFRGQPDRFCEDVDECLKNPCGRNSMCQNTPGSFICKCSAGYSGNAYDGCKDIDECTRNVCGNYAVCQNLLGSYECICPTGFDGNADVACKRVSVTVDCRNNLECVDNAECIDGRCHCIQGFKPHGSVCVDVNECQSKPCGVNTNCINTVGGHECVCIQGRIGDPYVGCKTPCDDVNCGPHASCKVVGVEAQCHCDLGYMYKPTDIALGCLDTNECDTQLGPSGMCGEGSICTNTPGSYKCTCPIGFAGDAFKGCYDINECSPQFGKTGKCGFNSLCKNTPGSYSCACPSGTTGNPFKRCDNLMTCYNDTQCPGHSLCTTGSCFCPSPNFGSACKHPCDNVFCGDNAKCFVKNFRPVCICASGYTGNYNSLIGCVDVNECLRNPCGDNAICRNVLGTYECICPKNFQGDAYKGCVPMVSLKHEKCSSANPCPVNEKCVQTNNDRQCVCNEGYIRDRNQFCRDLNECTENIGRPACADNARCINQPGTHECICNDGFTGNPYISCSAVVIRCKNNYQCPGNTLCLNLGGGKTGCGCPDPYRRFGHYCIMTSQNCSTTNPCPANQDCIYTGPEYGFCVCPQGYTLDINGKCRDIDECVELHEQTACGPYQECVNSPGSFECRCSTGYSGTATKGCRRISVECQFDAHCPDNFKCKFGQCQCLEPYMLRDRKCRHPCDWISCGPHSKCVLGRSGPKCSCAAGFKSDLKGGCWDINECTSRIPADPNGPCGVGATCINTVGSFVCQCSPRSGGDPYKAGCKGTPYCKTSRQCPPNALCDLNSGSCIDPCMKAVCGPNTYCVAKDHRALCVCRHGYKGDPTNIRKGCYSICNSYWCGKNAKCVIGDNKKPACKCPVGFIGNPYPGGVCRHVECDQSKPCSSGYKCVNYRCVEQCAAITCGVGAHCRRGKCQCYPLFVGDPNILCVPPIIPPICVPGCGLKSHCSYGIPNRCICNPGMSGNPYTGCSRTQTCANTKCGINAKCLQGINRIDCSCGAGFQGNPHQNCLDVNECLGNPCGVNALCINNIGSFQCSCPNGLIGNPLTACVVPPTPTVSPPPAPLPTAPLPTAPLPTAPVVCSEVNCPCDEDSDCSIGLVCELNTCKTPDPCAGVFCGIRAHCTRGICECDTDTVGDPNIQCQAIERNICEDDGACDTSSVCRPTTEGILDCFNACDYADCGANSICVVKDKQPLCECLRGYQLNNNYICVPIVPSGCTKMTDCPDSSVCVVVDASFGKCEDACKYVKCGPNAECISSGHRAICRCISGVVGNPTDLIDGCQLPHICDSSDGCPLTDVCKFRPDNIRDCHHACQGVRCGVNSECIPANHAAACICMKGYIGNPQTGCHNPNKCETSLQCDSNELCKMTLNRYKDCVLACRGYICGPNANCQVQHHLPLCKCITGYIGNPSDPVRGCYLPHECTSDFECPTNSVCRMHSTTQIKKCFDVCLDKQCGPNSYCLGSNHIASCQCVGSYIGNGKDLIKGCYRPDLCLSHDDCTAIQWCVDTSSGFKDCVAVCRDFTCGVNAQCQGLQHQPVCKCILNYVGDAYQATGCRSPDKCQKDSDCAYDEACRIQPDGIYSCFKVCSEVQCGVNAHCKASDHKAMCTCINPSYIGNPDDPNEGCRPPDKCRLDTDCKSDQVCRSRPDGIFDCIDACRGIKCGPYAECRAVHHSGVCECYPTYVGSPNDPLRGCSPPHKCHIDPDCPVTAICRADPKDNIKRCISVCKESICGPGAHCVGQIHRASCRCSGNYVGDPNNRDSGCYSPDKCENDFECPTTHACRTRPDGIKDCLGVCSDVTCGINAHCYATNHKSSCKCILNYIGNPSIRCNPPHKCITDNECSGKESCQLTAAKIKDCINVCLNIQCGQNAFCHAENHEGKCKCQADYIGNPFDLTEGCRSPHKCQTDLECPLTHACTPVNGINDCVNVCKGIVCGKNAVCRGSNHIRTCRCIKNYVGDALDTNVGCTPPHKCHSDRDCPHSAACRKQYPSEIKECIDVCVGIQCGPSAQCTAMHHKSSCVCSNSKYIGNPHDLLQGCYMPDRCTTHLDCPDSQSCQLTHTGIRDCINACNRVECGLNAKCVAKNHIGECKCILDYVGNAYDLAVGCIVPHKCTNDYDCTEKDACRKNSFGIKDCFDVCQSVQCGRNAQCEYKNHKPECRCKGNYVGNPYDINYGCVAPDKCQIDNDCNVDEACRLTKLGIMDCVPVCLGINCGNNAECYYLNHVAACRCVKNFVGYSYDVVKGCYPPHKCKHDSDCPVTAACKPRPTDGIRECIDVCTNIQCGPDAQCIRTNHQHKCTCNGNYIGNAYDLNRGCYSRDKCTSNQDCASTQACRPEPISGIKDCLNVCNGVTCGLNARCHGINHESVCKCVGNYIGNANDLIKGCGPPDLCAKHSDCHSNQVCRAGPSGINDCFEICPEIKCGPNARCEAYNHAGTCKCNGNYVGYPNDLIKGCHPPDKCKSNSDCPSNAVCKKTSSGIFDCIDACQMLRCGPNARCYAANHIGRCKCLQGYVGDASSIVRGCQLPHECTVDEECGSHQVCKSDATNINKCVLACIYVDCGPLANCIAKKHVAQCVCPPAYTGNPYDTIKGCKEIDLDECKHDRDCLDTHICKLDRAAIRKCIVACTTLNCGPEAFCSTKNHHPTCSCPPGFVGNAYNLVNGCKPPIKNECDQNSDCPSTDVCKPNNSGILKCIPVCLFVTCGPNSACFASNHVGNCQCKQNYNGNPFDVIRGCKYREPDQCKDNFQCPSFEKCEADTLGVRRCTGVCLDFTCSPRSNCVAVLHSGQCKCETGYAGNPLDRIGCIPVDRNDCDANEDCNSNEDECSSDQQGIRRCLDVCRFTICGPNAQCVPLNHYGVCQCPRGLYLGDPNDPIRGCYRVQCIDDSDCSTEQYCSSEHTCKDPCHNACGTNAVCIAQIHKALCKCLQGYEGRPEVGCTAIRFCDSNPCHRSAKCVDTPGSYSCFCPPQHIGDPYKQGCRHPNSCPNGDVDCPDNAACLPNVSGEPMCSNPCDKYRCGYGADCSVSRHKAQCFCPPGFHPFPDPTKLCVRIINKCGLGVSCSSGLGCIQNQCRVFCSGDSDCAHGEKCINKQCIYGCFSHTDCLPGLACVNGYCRMGCRRNSDCPSNKACIKNQCQDPCQMKAVCGPNTHCQVSQHVHRCTCLDGFKGNPTPEVGCKRVVNSCTSTVVCPPRHICVENRCRVTCGTCAEGELCYNNICLMLCTGDGNCPAGTVCLNQVCQVGCRSDSDCGFNMHCMANKCKCNKGYIFSGSECIDYNECESSPCHRTAVCVNSLGSFTCKCRDDHVGDPYFAPGCKPGVVKVIDPCLITNCGPNAKCIVKNERPVCECPKNRLYIGNAYDRSKGCIPVECLRNSDCSSDKLCLQNYCENPCSTTYCLNGICLAKNHQAYCKCNPGYELRGDRCIDIDKCLQNPCHVKAKCVNTPGSFTCQCPPGTVGDPFNHPGCHHPNACFNGDQDCPPNAKCINENGEPRCKNPCDLPNQCGINAQCEVRNHVIRCYCPPLYLGNARIHCKRVECVDDNGCSSHKACLRNKCVDLCSAGRCGSNTNCVARDHVSECSCLSGYQGDPIQGCRRIITCVDDDGCPIGEFCKDSHCRLACKSNRDCGSNERCVAGRCVVICLSNTDCAAGHVCDNGVCTPDLNKCFNDNECDDVATCRISNRGYNECMDPCENTICGRNAICVAKGHISICKCPPSYIGNPNDELKGCHIPECIQDTDCVYTKACSDNRCQNPCIVNDPCGPNALCTVKDHRADCICISGYEGNALSGCVAIDYCKKQPCHRTAVCKSTIGSYTCACPDAIHIGNAYSEPGCRLPHECPNGDPDCLDTAACRPNNQKLLMCINPCEDHQCGFNADCKVVNHQPQCVCPASFTGNPNDLTKGCYRLKLVCSTNADCNLGYVCHNYRCRPPCLRDSECGHKEICIQGKCILGCRSDPDCYNSEICINQLCSVGCRKNSDCLLSEACIGNQCKNPCTYNDPCGPNAKCEVVNHSPVCSCFSGFGGNPNIICNRDITECTSKADCPLNHFCKDGRCRVQCSTDSDCAINEKCYSNRCILLCTNDQECMTGEICVTNRCQIGCRENSQCSHDKACSRNQCINPCLENSCGPNANCRVVLQRATCTCPSGFTGNPTPNVGCIRVSTGCKSKADCPPGQYCSKGRCRVICSADLDCVRNEQCYDKRCHIQCVRDRDCPSQEICNHYLCQVGCRHDSQCQLTEVCIQNQCQDPCLQPTACGINAHCERRNHAAHCSCLPGLTGNPRVECVRARVECTTDDQCGVGGYCEHYICRVSCSNDIACLKNERCYTRRCSKICEIDSACPEGFICESGVCLYGCRNDYNCKDTESCINRQCINVCESPAACAPNAICNAISHRAQCTCPPKYTGNAKIQCKAIECIVDSECGHGKICQHFHCIVGCRDDSHCDGDKTCTEHVCQNPCNFNTCGVNALCETRAHKYRCYCRPGYRGNAMIGCVKEYVECQISSDCQPNYVCQNNRCILKVECQKDADCGSRYICQQFKCFSGCRTSSDCSYYEACIDKQCQDPCRRSDACGINAICKAQNHAANCHCQPGFTGNPRIQCTSVGPTCRLDNECGIGQRCFTEKCLAVTGCASDNDCNVHEICENNQCIDGCRSNSDCSFYHQCINRVCEDPCKYATCGTNADCRAIDHRGFCYCPPNYSGNAQILCTIYTEGCKLNSDCGQGQICISGRCVVGCRYDTDCDSTKACVQGSCQPVCSAPQACGLKANCRPKNHQPKCTCPQGYSGNPYIQCKLQDTYECILNNDCLPGHKCLNHICILIVEGCSADHECNRGEICIDRKCRVGCRYDGECRFEEACHSQQCANPCNIPRTCGQNAMCTPIAHRPHCSCPTGYIGTGYQTCTLKPVVEVECNRDEECQIGYICKRNKCIPGCNSDSRCPFDKACVNSRCQNPCSFPNVCGLNAQCQAVAHRADCYCPEKFILDQNGACKLVEIGACKLDQDCGYGQICENGRCIDGCRTDATCPSNKKCILRRCQNPCSVYGACGKNANCYVSYHEPICKCRAGYYGNPNVLCTIETDKVGEGCKSDNECLVGEYCKNGECIAGCRTSAQCPFNKACYEWQCKNPCYLPGICQYNAECVAQDHTAVCKCLPNYVGNPYDRCVPEEKEICRTDSDCPPRHICDYGKCILGCRKDPDCPTTQTCLYSRCQDPCSVFLACGRNANCESRSHTAHCTCPTGYKGDARVECYIEPPKVECYVHSDCSLRHICDNNICVPGCVTNENCLLVEACIRGTCQNPCLQPDACGEYAECTPINHRAMCICPIDYVGHPDIKCEPKPSDYCERDSDCSISKICRKNVCVLGCRDDSKCPLDEACLNGICQNKCKQYGTCAPNAICRSFNHDALCDCPIGYTGNPKVICEKIVVAIGCKSDSECLLGQICHNSDCIYGCVTNNNCPFDKACIKGECINPCYVSAPCGRGAYCTPSNHQAVCSCPINTLGNPKESCDRIIKVECEFDSECGLEKICVNNKCIIGCKTSDRCPYNKACINRYCQDPCAVGRVCGQGAQCHAISHLAQCSCLSGYKGDPKILCTKERYECEQDSHCGQGFVCRNRKCQDIDECLERPGPCAYGAICLNSRGSYKCTCPPSYTGDPYTQGCEHPPVGCQKNSDCANNEACDRASGNCYDPCSKIDVCGKNARCRAYNHRATCFCPPGYQGQPEVECFIKRICSSPKDCDGNLHCLDADLCGCPNGYQRLGPYCIRTRIECSTTNPCPQNQRCIIIGNRPGFCTCPRGFKLNLNGQCIDQNECETSACAIGAECINKRPGYECVCLPGMQGDPYSRGCSKPDVECRRDQDCSLTLACDLNINKCINPCNRKICGRKAMCSVVDHKPICSCELDFTGNPLVECFRIVTCPDCPGNLMCLNGVCSCLPNIRRIGDYCVHTSFNCTTTNPCNPNEECIYIGPPPGFCVCPQGFELINGNCVDINECIVRPDACVPTANCINTIGSYECLCPEGAEGDPYFGDCITKVSEGCTQNSDCNTNARCDIPSRECIPVCYEGTPCGINAICVGRLHVAVCSCPIDFTGNPKIMCYPIVGCQFDHNCPGNLMCLEDGSCGCPSRFKQLGEFCIITTQQCTTTDPCPDNEECIYTGVTKGFCVCPRGYRISINGECVVIDHCLELAQPCGPGAICNNTHTGYTCTCPPGTIGTDPYNEGCITIGCKSNNDCRNDLECDLQTGECISPCYVCNRNAICEVIDHKATCQCPPGYVGDPYDKQFPCFPDEEIQTPLPPGEMNVECLADGIKVNMILDSFKGIVYVKGHSTNEQCRRIIDSDVEQNIRFKVFFDTCGLIHIDGEASFVLVIQKHPKLVTWKAKAYHIKCVYGTGEKTITLGFNVSMITTAGTIANTGPPPTCLMQICTSDGKEVSNVNVGDKLMLKLDIQPSYIYGGFARECYAKTFENGEEVNQLVTDKYGCATDNNIFGEWRYDSEKKVLLSNFDAFKFPSSDNIRFHCNIRVCFGACPPVNCDGVDAFGRKKRQISDDDADSTDLQTDTLSTVLNIDVESNSVRAKGIDDDEATQASSEDPSLTPSSDICISKYSLIISIIITTLLALVAIAIAVACWLMAYRRKPKSHGPLPHPTDFPNPLYTTPEPVAEPTPDYVVDK